MSNGPKLELELHKPSLLWFAPLSVLNRHQENKYPHPEWIQPITGKNTQSLCSLAGAEVNDIFQYTEIRTDSTFSSGHVFLFFFSFFILKCFPLHIYLKGRKREREGEKQRVHASNCFHLLGHCWEATLSRTVMGQNQEIEIQVCHRSGRDLMIETAGAGCQSLHQQAAGARSQSQALDSGAPMWNPALVSTGETPANQWILPSESDTTLSAWEATEERRWMQPAGGSCLAGILDLSPGFRKPAKCICPQWNCPRWPGNEDVNSTEPQCPYSSRFFYSNRYHRNEHRLFHRSTLLLRCLLQTSSWLPFLGKAIHTGAVLFLFFPSLPFCVLYTISPSAAALTPCSSPALPRLLLFSLLLLAFFKPVTTAVSSAWCWSSSSPPAHTAIA